MNKTNSFFTFVILTLLAIGACFFSINLLFNNSLRLDESQSLWQTSHTPEKILKIVASDVHVPLYHILLHYWIIIYQLDIYNLRLLSLMFFLMSIYAVYLLCKSAYQNTTTAIFSSFLFTFSAYLQWYSSELRMYSLFVLLTILNQYFFLKIWKNGHTFGWLGYIFTSLLGIYTHYFFLILLFTEAIFWLIYKPQSKHFYGNIILTYLYLFIAYLPWLLLIRTQNSNNTRPILIEPSSIDIFNLFSQLFFGYQDNFLNTIIISSWPLIIGFIFFSIQKSTKTKIETVFFLYSAFIPVFIVYLVSVFLRPAFLSRYLVFILPSLLILISNYFFSLQLKFFKYAIKITAVIIFIMSLIIQSVSSSTPVREDFRSVAEYISLNSSFRDVIVLSAPFLIYPFEYYYTGKPSIDTIPKWNRFSDDSIPNYDRQEMIFQINEFKQKYNSIWIIMGYDQGNNLEIIKYFETNFDLLEKKEFSPGLEIYNFKLRYDW